MYRAHPNDGIAWVTGASSGIGRAVALELAQRGFEVANGLFGLAMPDRHLDAVFDMMLQDGFAHLIEPGAYRSDLRQHVVTLAPLFPQALEAVGMASDTCEPPGDIFA